MKKIIIFTIFILILIGGGYYYLHKQKVNKCKEECIYIPFEYEYPGAGVERFLKDPKKVKADYWRFGKFPNYRKFQTQEQCIDYCLHVK